MTHDNDLLTGEQVRLEVLRKLKESQELRPSGYFPWSQIWEPIWEGHPGKIDAPFASSIFDSLMQEKLAQSTQAGGILAVRITEQGLQYLDRVDNKSQKGNVVINIGTISESNVNIMSVLQDVVQTIGSSNVDEEAKKQLADLIVELNTKLQAAPKETRENAEKVEAIAQVAKSLVEEGTKPNPNKTIVQINGEGLKKAAENILGVMPVVLAIVKTVFQLTGLPFP